MLEVSSMIGSEIGLRIGSDYGPPNRTPKSDSTYERTYGLTEKGIQVDGDLQVADAHARKAAIYGAKTRQALVRMQPYVSEGVGA